MTSQTTLKLKQKVIIQAEDLGWDILFEKPEHYQVRFSRNEIRMDVWYSKMTVSVIEKGKEPKYYRFVSEKKLDQLLDNPIQINL